MFVLDIVAPDGTAVLSGDGGFTVLGGTRSYPKASGEFVTVFEPCPVAPGSNKAVADVYQLGTISKR